MDGWILPPPPRIPVTTKVLGSGIPFLGPVDSTWLGKCKVFGLPPSGTIAGTVPLDQVWCRSFASLHRNAFSEAVSFCGNGMRSNSEGASIGMFFWGGKQQVWVNKIKLCWRIWEVLELGVYCVVGFLWISLMLGWSWQQHDTKNTWTIVFPQHVETQI